MTDTRLRSGAASRTQAGSAPAMTGRVAAHDDRASPRAAGGIIQSTDRRSSCRNVQSCVTGAEPRGSGVAPAPERHARRGPVPPCHRSRRCSAGRRSRSAVSSNPPRPSHHAGWCTGPARAMTPRGVVSGAFGRADGRPPVPTTAPSGHAADARSPTAFGRADGRRASRPLPRAVMRKMRDRPQRSTEPTDAGPPDHCPEWCQMGNVLARSGALRGRTERDRTSVRSPADPSPQRRGCPMAIDTTRSTRNSTITNKSAAKSRRCVVCTLDITPSNRRRLSPIW